MPCNVEAKARVLQDISGRIKLAEKSLTELEQLTKKIKIKKGFFERKDKWDK
jgi:hypothetical protein